MSEHGPSGEGGSRATMDKGWLWLLLPVAIGFYVRLYRLSAQVVGGDELHAVRAALKMPWRKVLVTYRNSDNCIPLTFLYRLCMDAGLPAKEWLLKAPILLCGVALLVVVPLWTWRRLGGRSALCVAWLLALSPTMVHYSRIVRSYMPLVLFGFLAVAAFDDWFRTRRPWSGVAYVLCGSLAAWFHLAAVPFVLSPFLFFAAVKLLKGNWPAPSWRAGTLLGMAQVAGFSAFLIPAWASLRRLAEMKQGASTIHWKTFKGLAGLQAGSAHSGFVALFWLLAFYGLFRLARKRPELAGLSVTLLLGQIVGMAILSPLGVNQASIFGRYMLVTLPWVFIWTAYGLVGDRTAESSRGERRLLAAGPNSLAQLALAGLLLAGLTATGPLAKKDFREGSFVQRAEALLFYHGRRAKTVQVPGVYSEITGKGPVGPLIEYPWHPMWRYGRAFVRYQVAHGREVIVSPGERLLWDERLEFQNMIPPSPRRILQSRAAFLAVHSDPAGEEKALDSRRKRRSEKARRDLERRRKELEKLALQAARRRELFERLWGEADFEADGVAVWNLDRIRSST